MVDFLYDDTSDTRALDARTYTEANKLIYVHAVDNTDYTDNAAFVAAYAGITENQVVAGLINNVPVIMNVELGPPVTAYQRINVTTNTINQQDTATIVAQQSGNGAYLYSFGEVNRQWVDAGFNRIGNTEFGAAVVVENNDSVNTYVSEHPTIRATTLGTRVSGNEYSGINGGWVAPTSTDWPIDATFFTSLIAQKRPALDDTSLNPSSTITLTAVDAGGVTAATMTGYDGAHRGLRFGTAGSGGLTMTFANCLNQRVVFTGTFGVGTSSGGATQDYEVVDESGTQVATWTIAGVGNDPGTAHTFSFEFTAGAGDEVYTLRKRSTGTSQAVYMFNYSMTVFVDEPDLIEGVVFQVDSETRGVMLPRIIPTVLDNHSRGAIALNRVADDRPMWHDGEDWAYFPTTRVGFRSIDTGQFFFAEGGTFNDAGWTGSNHQRLIYTENHQGFPAVVRCTQSGGTITIQAPNNTQALWDTAFANGFRVDYRMMFGATFDGSVWMDIEPNNTSWGQNGRFEANVTSNAGQLQMTMINTGGNTTFDMERDTMYTISMICPAGGLTAEMHVDGQKVGEITYGGGGTTDRGTFFYIPPGNPVNDFSFQMITMYTLSAADSDVTLSPRALATGYRYNVPNISSPMRIRTSKGLQDGGNAFTVANGSTKPVIVSGQDDDRQLFGGVPEFTVPPNTQVTFGLASFPRGTDWSVSGGQTIVNHEDVITPSFGNTLHLTIDSSGSIVGRHGTYLGSDVSAARTTTGQYTITVTSSLFNDATTVEATPKHGAGQDMTVNATTGGLGQVIVDVKQSSVVTLNIGGTDYDLVQQAALVNDSFYVSIYW